jgi:hypothetical protein
MTPEEQEKMTNLVKDIVGWFKWLNLLLRAKR